MACCSCRIPKWRAVRNRHADSAKSKRVAETLLGSVRLREQSRCRGAEQEWLFESWLYAMFFPELFPTRPSWR